MSGELQVAPWRDGLEAPKLKATLTSTGPDSAHVLPELFAASVRRVTAKGIVIAGYEVIARRPSNKSFVDHWPQTWWCLVHTIELARMLDLGEFDDVIPAPSATGF